LQRRLTEERVPEVSEGHGEEESNTHEEEDRKSRRAPERSQTDNQSQRTGGSGNPLAGERENREPSVRRKEAQRGHCHS
jgi:hypothetical protein